MLLHYTPTQYSLPRGHSPSILVSQSVPADTILYFYVSPLSNACLLSWTSLLPGFSFRRRTSLKTVPQVTVGVELEDGRLKGSPSGAIGTNPV